MSQGQPTNSKPVTIEHQVVHCPDCGKLASVEVCPLAPEKFVQLYRAKLIWCAQCQGGYVGIQKFNGVGWDFKGQQFQTRNRDYLIGLRGRVDRATDPEKAIERESGQSRAGLSQSGSDNETQRVA